MSKRRGVIDYILTFIVLFMAFIWMLFLVIGYSNVGRIQSSLDIMTTQGSRVLSTSGNIDSFVNIANQARLNLMQTIVANDLIQTCVDDGGRIVTISVSFLYDPPVLSERNITSSASAYNEQNSSSCQFFLNII